MSPAEKAKAYDEALEKARKYHAAAKSINDPSAARYENIFPELRESEDERIRMALCDIARDMPYMKTELRAHGLTVEKVITYLEKQKEQKPIEDVVKDITKNKESAIKFLKSAGIMDDNGELAEMYRSEQEPAKWSEEDESCWNLIWDILDGPFTASKEGCKKAATWFLKNCPKGTKSLRPSWKSSEEDKEMKLKILKYLSTRCSVEQFEEVEEWLNNKLNYVFI